MRSVRGDAEAYFACFACFACFAFFAHFACFACCAHIAHIAHFARFACFAFRLVLESVTPTGRALDPGLPIEGEIAIFRLPVTAGGY